MKLPATESERVGDLHSADEEFGWSARSEFRGRLHDAWKYRWNRGWKSVFEPWIVPDLHFTDKLDCMSSGRFGNAVVISSLGEADDMEKFGHRFANRLSGGSRIEMPSEIQKAITASRSILGLEYDWDDQESPRYAESTWRRATEFLLRQADFARVSLGRDLPVPVILPGPNGSIDLHWKLAGFELLVNIPSDAAQPATFYGDDYRDSCIRGNLNPREEVRGLVVWLVT